MKKPVKIYFLALIALIVSITVSCTKDPEITDPVIIQSAPRLINVTAGSSGGATKTTLVGLETHWIAGVDKIGIFSPQALPDIGGAAEVLNVDYTAGSSDKISSFTGQMYWGVENHDFFAYYPWAEGSPVSGSVPIKLPPVQTQSEGGNSDHIGDLDFLIAEPLKDIDPGDFKDGPATGINFIFNHVFTLLEFRIINANADLSEIRLTSDNRLGFSTGTVDLDQQPPVNGGRYSKSIRSEIPSGQSNEVILNVDTPATTTGDFEDTPKLYLMIEPGITGWITISIKEGDDYRFFMREAPSGGFARGAKYTVNLDMDDATVYPGTDLDPVEWDRGNNITWAPVNAGYNPDRPHGLYYQWHRPYGQDSPPSIAEGPVQFETGIDASTSNIFYRRPGMYDNWAEDLVQNTWEMGDNDQYNPCPAGWRLPTEDEFDEITLFTTSFKKNYNYGPHVLDGMVFPNATHGMADELFLPASGLIGHDGELWGKNDHGRYRFSDSGDTDNNNRAHPFSLSSGGSRGISVSSWGKVRAYSVRCVKDI